MLFAVSGTMTVRVKFYVLDAGSAEEAMIIAEGKALPRVTDLRDILGVYTEDTKPLIEIEGDSMHKFEDDIEVNLTDVECIVKRTRE